MEDQLIPIALISAKFTVYLNCSSVPPGLELQSPLTNLTSILVAPASSEFSISSFTTQLTDVITCELAIDRIVEADRSCKVDAILHLQALPRTTRFFNTFVKHC